MPNYNSARTAPAWSGTNQQRDNGGGGGAQPKRYPRSPSAASSRQITALQAAYSARCRAGDPIFCPQGKAYTADRLSRLDWASAVLGARVDTFSLLTETQAAYLLDWLRLGPGHSKIDRALTAAFAACQIADPDAWLAGWWKVQGRACRAYWSFHGRQTIGSLTRYQRIQLLGILRARIETAGCQVSGVRCQEQQTDTRNLTPVVPAVAVSAVPQASSLPLLTPQTESPHAQPGTPAVRDPACPDARPPERGPGDYCLNRGFTGD